MSLLCNAKTSQLVVIDIQERLAAVMPDKVLASMMHNTETLLKAANLLEITVIRSEQYPQGLGKSKTEVSQHFNDETALVEKTCFACTDSPDFTHQLSKKRRPQIILTGIESHICVLQTALELHAQGFQVFVVEDAVCSRDRKNHKNAIKRLRAAGVTISNTESVIFEWLGDAQHEHFKAISKLIK